MRNDQIAVMLRDFANRCMQWAVVLEKESETPLTDDDLKRAVVSMQLPGTDARTPPSVVVGTRLFRCWRCNREKTWHLERPPWHGAVCRECYAESLMRRDDVNDVVRGYERGL